MYKYHILHNTKKFTDVNRHDIPYGRLPFKHESICFLVFVYMVLYVVYIDLVQVVIDDIQGCKHNNPVY